MSVGLPTTIKFSVDWTIPWSMFGADMYIEKNFVTSYNNVTLSWRIALSRDLTTTTDTDLSWRRVEPKLGFYLYYKNGPLEKFNGMNYTVAIVKPDQTTSGEMKTLNYEALRSRCFGIWHTFGAKDCAAVRQQYGLEESDALTYRIVLKIPISAFSYKIENPLSTTTPPHLQWLVDLFNVIDDSERSKHSNATLISRVGHRFYCHKIFSFQSAALDAMFRHPPGENQAENEYEFPGLGTDSLKALIQFLYTGQATLDSLSTTELIDLADAAEQYDLKPLKQACASVLWDRVVKEPIMCYHVVRFADLHDELKYLKYRAMDILAENSDTAISSSRFGEGIQGKKLLDEFLLFACRRVKPI